MKRHTMKRHTPALALVLLLLLTGIAIAQTGDVISSFTQPVLVTVSQVIPADITLAIPQDDGAVLTVTAPITVGVNLQITLDGAHVTAVEAGETEPPAVVVEELAPTADPAPLSQTVNDITVEVLDLIVFPFDALADEDPDAADHLRRLADFDPAAAGLLTIRVTNGADEPDYIVPIQHAALVVGADQIDLAGYYTLITGDLDGDYYPGVTKEGGVAFAMQQSTWDAIVAGAPVNYFIDTADSKWAFKIAPTLPIE